MHFPRFRFGVAADTLLDWGSDCNDAEVPVVLLGRVITEGASDFFDISNQTFDTRGCHWFGSLLNLSLVDFLPWFTAILDSPL